MNKMEIVNLTRIYELNSIIKKYTELGLTEEIKYKDETKYNSILEEMFERIIEIECGSISKESTGYYIKTEYKCGGRITVEKNVDCYGKITQINTLSNFDEKNYEEKLTEEEITRINESYDLSKDEYRELKYHLEKENEL